MTIVADKFTYGQQNISVIFSKEFPSFKVKIGKFCSIASNIKIYAGHGYHDSKNVSTYPFGHVETSTFGNQKYNLGTTNGDVIIENDVWIGDNVTIMSGVTIGNGAVIATNSHVVKNVEPYTIVGGNPAQLIKKRFDQRIIDNLLEIKWWDKSVEEIINFKNLLNSQNIEEFLDKITIK